MLQNYYYHKTIRKLVSSFGTMFNNIVIMKYDENGLESERIKVPLSYALKEKFIYDLAYDSTLTKPIQIQLPRMSFELVGFTYDSNRKLPTIGKIYGTNSANNKLLVSNYQPVPYDFSFDLNIYTRNQDDLAQIIEQILPYFTPDFTITMSLVQDNGVEIKRDVPIINTSTTPHVEYEGDSNSPRYVTCNMTFTMKAYLFGPTNGASIIRKAITNIYDTVGDPTEIDLIMYSGGEGNYKYEEEVYSGNTWVNATWRGRVISWSNTSYRLNIYQVQGKALPNTGDVVFGVDSGAQYTLSSTNRLPLKHAKITLEPVPNTANVGTANSFSVLIEEFPKIITG